MQTRTLAAFMLAFAVGIPASVWALANWPREQQISATLRTCEPTMDAIDPCRELEVRAWEVKEALLISHAPAVVPVGDAPVEQRRDAITAVSC